MRSFRPFAFDGQGALCERDASTGNSLSFGTTPFHNGSSVMTGGPRETLYLGNLALVIDRLQELFELWEAQKTFQPQVTVDMLQRAQLAVHEWIANLVQHADFQDRVPEIALSLWVHESKLCCVIADNSEGFSMDLSPSITLEEVCEVLPDRGMGLLLLHACADDLCYQALSERRHCLEFAIS